MSRFAMTSLEGISVLLIAQLLTPTVALAQQVIRSTTTIVGETLTFVLDRAIS